MRSNHNFLYNHNYNYLFIFTSTALYSNIDFYTSIIIAGIILSYTNIILTSIPASFNLLYRLYSVFYNDIITGSGSKRKTLYDPIMIICVIVCLYLILA